MRPLILSVALIFASTTVNAESWYQIAESNDKSYTIEFDLDTVDLGKYNNDKPEDGLYITGVSRYLSHGKELTKQASAVDVEECLTKTTGAIKTEWPDGKTEMSIWKATGDSGVDHRARFLCGFINGTLKGLTKPKQQPQPKKIWI